MREIIATPDQAATIYSLDGPGTVRPKSLFTVAFYPNWDVFKGHGVANDLQFVVKSVDRPQITPEVQELHQYNKKRQIVTGYKLSPIKMSFYDTADSKAQSMWAQYAKYYYGDFKQKSEGWRYDITTANQNGTSFGYVPSSSTDMNSQYFFDAICIFQVFGGYYTQYTLVNPKITSYDPDDLAFDNSDAATISITLTYEGLIYENDGKPIALKGGAFRSPIDAFNNQYNGNVLDVSGLQHRNGYGTSNSGLSGDQSSSSIFNSLFGGSFGGQSSGSGQGGALSGFGNFNFGNIVNAVAFRGLVGNTQGLGANLAYMATGSPVLATLLNLGNNRSGVSTSSVLTSLGISALTGQSGGISGAAYDVARVATGAGSNAYGQSYAANNLTSGVMAASAINGNSPTNQVYRPNSATNGMALSNTGYGVVNNQRPTYSQIGFNPGSSGYANQLPTFGKNIQFNSPSASNTATPSLNSPTSVDAPSGPPAVSEPSPFGSSPQSFQSIMPFPAQDNSGGEIQ